MRPFRRFFELGVCMIMVLSLLVSCTKEFPRQMAVLTLPLDSITAKALGEIIDLGDQGISNYGFVYDSNSYISANAQRVQLGKTDATGRYGAFLTNLHPNTRYYVNSFLYNGSETIYGDQVSFRTALNLPLVKTDSVMSIKDSTATCIGEVMQDGGALVYTRGVCWNTRTQPTLLNDHTVDGSGIGIFTSRLSNLKNDSTYFVRTYASNNAGTIYGNELYFKTLTTCGSLTINHVAGNVAPVSKTVTYGTVKNIPGEPEKCWITSNLGANHQATAVDDNSEASAGWYWQFNRKQGYKHDGTIRLPDAAWQSSIDENLDWQTANDPCTIELGSSWRLPTYTEWFNVDDNGGWSNWNGPANSGLKLHAAGRLNVNDGSLNSRGAGGYYWSSTQGSADYSWDLDFSNENSLTYLSNKGSGFTLRCLREY